MSKNKKYIIFVEKKVELTYEYLEASSKEEAMKIIKEVIGHGGGVAFENKPKVFADGGTGYKVVDAMEAVS